MTLEGSAIGSVPLDAVAGRNRPVPADHPLLAAAAGLVWCWAERLNLPGGAG